MRLYAWMEKFLPNISFCNKSSWNKSSPIVVCSISWMICFLMINKFQCKFSKNDINESIQLKTLPFSLFASTNMPEVKIFRLVQSFHQKLGLNSSQSNQIHTSKFRVLLLPACIASGLTSMLGFLIFEAKTIQVISCLLFLLSNQKLFVWFF